MRAVRVAMTIDTEEDQWVASRGPLSAQNLRALPALARFIEVRLGLRPTWFCAHQVTQDPFGSAWLKTTHTAGAGEIAAHLHPWNTPPTPESMTDKNSMTCNLPPSLIREKLLTLAAALTAATGDAPRAFRAGRFGFGPTVAAALRDTGYRVDCSVIPHKSWAAYGDGPSFVGASTHIRPISDAHFQASVHSQNRSRGRGLSADGPLLVADAPPLVEVPVSSGFSRRGRLAWSQVQRGMHRFGLGEGRLSALAWKTRLVRRVFLNPENFEVSDMLRVARGLVDSGAKHLVVFVHSPSFTPGLSPFVRDRGELDRLYGRIDALFCGLSAFCNPAPATVSELASGELGPTPEVASGRRSA